MGSPDAECVHVEARSGHESLIVEIRFEPVERMFHAERQLAAAAVGLGLATTSIA